MVKHPRVEDDTNQREDFLRRWSRRKAAEEENANKSEPTSASEPVESEPEQQPLKTDADMPPVESIDESTDMRDFFSPEVSDNLRQAALRKLFHLPKFNIVDGLNDYDDDYTTFAPLGDIITADMRHQMELEKERQAAAKEAEGASEETVEAAETIVQTDKSEADPAEVERNEPGEEGDDIDKPSAESNDDNVLVDDDDYRNS